MADKKKNESASTEEASAPQSDSISAPAPAAPAPSAPAPEPKTAPARAESLVKSAADESVGNPDYWKVISRSKGVTTYVHEIASVGVLVRVGESLTFVPGVKESHLS